MEKEDAYIPVSFVLMATAKQIGERCAKQNYGYTVCKRNDAHPDKCIREGRAVHECVHDVIKESQKHCGVSFSSFCECMAKNHSNFEKCRDEQLAFEKCATEKM